MPERQLMHEDLPARLLTNSTSCFLTVEPKRQGIIDGKLFSFLMSLVRHKGFFLHPCAGLRVKGGYIFSIYNEFDRQC